ncbi:unnamed protein product [Dovyalis caffra]|uniref:Uncharacterized protein n=1 Tax=Dovyalis caffra TaxID=77055 RepID=A0AAV1QSQ4_9ROSI|nr:unnamed protein product [Dovyalis caffra]
MAKSGEEKKRPTFLASNGSLHGEIDDDESLLFEDWLNNQSFGQHVQQEVIADGPVKIRGPSRQADNFLDPAKTLKKSSKK